MIPVKIEISENDDSKVITAETVEGVIAGKLEFENVSKEMIRIIHIGVLEEYRRGGIATTLIDALTSYIKEEDEKSILAVWYDDEDIKDGFGEFIENIHLFDLRAEIIGKRTVHIAIWNGNILDEQYTEE